MILGDFALPKAAGYCKPGSGSVWASCSSNDRSSPSDEGLSPREEPRSGSRRFSLGESYSASGYVPQDGFGVNDRCPPSEDILGHKGNTVEDAASGWVILGDTSSSSTGTGTSCLYCGSLRASLCSNSR